MAQPSGHVDREISTVDQRIDMQDEGSATAIAFASPLTRFYRQHPLATTSIAGIVVIMIYIAIRNGIGVADKMVWDWLDILIFPVVLAVGAIGYDSIERQRDERREEDKRNRALEIEDQRAQAVALQTYLDQMSALMIDKKLRETSSDSDERVLAQARTLTILLTLGPDRKRHPLKLVAQMHLIDKESPVIKLPHADLNDANLAEVTLVNVDLTDVDLRGANLTGARLSRTVLTEADLRGADLSGADLTDANLRDADLRDARYDAETIWPHRFDPAAAGAVAE